MKNIFIKSKSGILISMLVFVLICGCNFLGQNAQRQLIIFHAGSLSVPFHQLADSFRAKHPEVRLKLEAAGSRQCARKITELGKECDIMASADYTVIEELLIPEHTEWYISFASNEMCLAYTDQSYLKDSINQMNWYRILAGDQTHFGRSNPDLDPCGYRTILAMKLAEIYYQEKGMANKLLSKDRQYIRPKETDLLTLLETHTLDYIFIYRSVAEQHELNYLVLPDSINLKKPGLAGFYQKAAVSLSGKQPGDTIIKKGEAMVYALTMLKNAPNKADAKAFLQYLFSENGRQIMEMNGQPTVIPSKNPFYEKVPDIFKEYIKK